MSSPVLTPEVLYDLAYGYPELCDTWYLYAIACLTELNLPEEIPRVFHFALIQQLYEYEHEPERREFWVGVAQGSVSSSEEYAELFKNGEELAELEIPGDKTGLKYDSVEEARQKQRLVVDSVHEMLLKISMFVGMPKSINSFMVLLSVTPKGLLSDEYKRRGIAKEDHAGVETIAGVISEESIDVDSVVSNLVRGSEYFETFYGEAASDVRRDFLHTYPDLWYFVYHHVYSPLLGFNDVLDPRETSLALISCILPQGLHHIQVDEYLQAALHFGATPSEVTHVKQLVTHIMELSKK
ncbi:hypothetical protein Cantr_10572 [Candida viswanathii]|uniref:Carboxymuconolactone decarboxylase-like domain-containing protein n=1 Tax=Candida viswanathii TaxID=5486 RepID=A0A367YEZ2_9ASCO|nr:hypothetical protein Cantr_10572 [Candida viswanathii]